MTHLEEEIRHVFDLPDSTMAVRGVDEDFNDLGTENLDKFISRDQSELLINHNCSEESPTPEWMLTE